MAASANIKGIAAMCFAMAVFMVNDSCVKLASQTLSVGQVVMIRGFFGTALALAFVVATGIGGQLRHLLKPIVAFRCVLEGLTAICFIAALALLPIATVTAVFLVSPLMITAAGAIFFKEQVGWRRWLAVGIGFLGMLVVVRPTAEGMNLGVLLVLLSTVLAVTRDLITRKLDPGIPTGVVAVGTIVMATVVGGALALVQPWRPVEAPVLAPLALAALTVTIGNYAMIMAFRTGEVSVVSPFRYTLMIWGVIAGFVVFGEWPDQPTWIGVALIVGAGLYTLYRETIRARAKAAT